MPRGMHGRHAGTEKAKDFKGTIRKLIRYMSAFKVHMLFVAVFAVCGTIFNIVGPKILGKATTEIFNGLVSKVSGGSGIDRAESSLRSNYPQANWGKGRLLNGGDAAEWARDVLGE